MVITGSFVWGARSIVVVVVIVIETVIGLTAVLDYDNDYRCADNDYEEVAHGLARIRERF